jgi:hypothetical protein
MIVAGVAMSMCMAGFAQDKSKQPEPTKAPAKHAEPHTPGKNAAATPPGVDMDMMKKMEEAGKIGQEHMDLHAAMIGEWTAKCSFKMAPDAEPMLSEGTAKFEAVMGGRFVAMNFTGEMMGQPFKGQGFFGFNNTSKKYESIWMDNMMTGIMTENGTKEGNTINWSGENTCPMTGELKNTKSKTIFNSKTQMTHEMWDTTSDGKSFKAGEIVYTRTGKTGETINPARTNTTPKTAPTNPK